MNEVALHFDIHNTAHIAYRIINRNGQPKLVIYRPRSGRPRKKTNSLEELNENIIPRRRIFLPVTNFVKSLKAKEKYRGVFEIQKSGDKTSSGEIGLDIGTHASPKVGQDQVSGGVSVLCWHAAPVAYVLWKPCTIR